MNVQSSGTQRQAQSFRPRTFIGMHFYLAVLVLAVNFLIVKNVAADTFSTRELTNTAWDNGFPVISGDTVAYEDFRNAGTVFAVAYPFAGISTYNLSTNTSNFTIPTAAVGGFTLAPMPWHRSEIAISGDNIVWTGIVPYGSTPIPHSYDIYDYNFTTGLVRDIGTSAGDKSSPDISGSRVIWMDPLGANGSHWDLYLYDLSSGNLSQFTTGLTSKYPSIDGNQVVWQDERSGSWEVFAKDTLTLTEHRIDSGLVPDISGNTIVYTKQFSSTGGHIWAYNLLTGENFQLTPDADLQERAFVSGRWVVYTDSRSGKFQIYVYDLVTRQEFQLSDGLFDSRYPQIDGNRAVWMEDISGNWQIFESDLSSDSAPAPVATPEPSGWILLVSGLLGMAVLSRGRRIKSRIRI